MSKKQIKWVIVGVEVLLIAALFLPAGRTLNGSGREDNSLSVFGMIARYGGLGFGTDALFYMILACALPVAVVGTVFLLHERYNFGAATLLSALQTASSACFFSAVSRKLVDYTALTMLPYLIVLVQLASVLLLIYAFLLSKPGERRGSNETNEGKRDS